MTDVEFIAALSGLNGGGGYGGLSMLITYPVPSSGWASELGRE